MSDRIEKALKVLAVTNKPRYQHDCDECVSLGQFEEYDLFYCDQRGNPTIIARYGDEGNYRSGMVFGKTRVDPALTVAYDRACERGLINDL